MAAGATLAVAPGPSLLGLVGVLLVLGRGLSRWVGLAAVGCFLVGGLVANLTLERFEERRVSARDAFGEPQRCAITGRIASSPSWVGRLVYTLDVEDADCASARVAPGTRVRLGGGPAGLARGDRVFVVAQLAPIELWHNLDLSDPRMFAARSQVLLSGSALSVEVERRGFGPFHLIDRARAVVRRRILSTFAPAAQPMARALVLGENDLDPEDSDAFRRSGLAHMLAVSGTHLVFAVISLVRILTALLVRIQRLSAGRDMGRWASAVGALLALGYADFAGGSGSAWRAAWMLSAAFAARALGRTPCASRSLGVSVWVGWLHDPLVAFDISFLLSAAATAGLLLLGEPLARPCERLRSRLGRFVGGSIAATLSAMIPCAPLLALLGTDLTLAGVIANVIASPLGETIALPLCLSHAVVSAWPALESGIGVVASGALLVVRQIAHESAAARFLAFAVPEPTGYHLSLCAVLAAALMARASRGPAPAPADRGKARSKSAPSRLGRWARVWLCLGALGLWAVEIGARRAGRPRGELALTVLDVGQGDSNLIDLPDGTLMLVDGGGSPNGGSDPGARVVLPVLRARRRDRIDVMVLSHPHPDHFGGLLAVARAVPVKELWDTGQGEREGAGPIYADLIEALRAQGTRILGPAELCGTIRRFGGAEVKVLAPCPDYTPGRGANDNSIVMRLAFGRRVFLMTGDAEKVEEAELVRKSPGLLRADVLKVGHHGSRTSTGTELIALVAPRVATISCGTRNRFGHPTLEVLSRLDRHGVRALRTDHLGGIAIRTDGAGLSTRTARPEREPASTPLAAGLELTSRLRKALLSGS